MTESTRLSAARIDDAVRVLEPYVLRTDLDVSPRLTQRIGLEVLLKRENRQLTRSYKVRGAMYVISGLTASERARGVICASAGNHAQGVAWSCARLGISGQIVVPSSTPRQKRERITTLGGDNIELIISGSSYDEANVTAQARAEQTGAVFVHPFDDPGTIVGQGTIAHEVVEQCQAQTGKLPGAIFVPVGGGGLVAGIALWIKENSPTTKIVGVEPAGAASMTAALAANQPVQLDQIDNFVDGAAVGRVGDLTFPVVRDLVDDLITVPEGAVCAELLSLYQVDGVITEPAGALASAGAVEVASRSAGIAEGPVVCIVSGGNNDVSRYAEIVERSLVYEGLRHYFLVSFTQKPGALRQFLDELLTDGEDIVTFEYMKKNNREIGPALVGIDLVKPDNLAPLLERMAASSIDITPVPAGSPLFHFLT